LIERHVGALPLAKDLPELLPIPIAYARRLESSPATGRVKGDNTIFYLGRHVYVDERAGYEDAAEDEQRQE
jgi:hypothetical protein